MASVIYETRSSTVDNIANIWCIRYVDSFVCHPRQPGSQHTVALPPCAETLGGEDVVCKCSRCICIVTVVTGSLRFHTTDLGSIPRQSPLFTFNGLCSFFLSFFFCCSFFLSG